jgi:hypothetical protein
MLDRMPNVYTGDRRHSRGAGAAAARGARLLRQVSGPHPVWKDTYEASEYPYYWRTFETADEYFDYYRDYHAFWKLYGLDLPDVVLRKVYYGNALKIVPGLPAGDFPPVADSATASRQN